MLNLLEKKTAVINNAPLTFDKYLSLTITLHTHTSVLNSISFGKISELQYNFHNKPWNMLRLYNKLFSANAGRYLVGD